MIQVVLCVWSQLCRLVWTCGSLLRDWECGHVFSVCMYTHSVKCELILLFAKVELVLPWRYRLCILGQQMFVSSSIYWKTLSLFTPTEQLNTTETGSRSQYYLSKDLDDISYDIKIQSPPEENTLICIGKSFWNQIRFGKIINRLGWVWDNS